MTTEKTKEFQFSEKGEKIRSWWRRLFFINVFLSLFCAIQTNNNQVLGALVIGSPLTYFFAYHKRGHRLLLFSLIFQVIFIPIVIGYSIFSWDWNMVSTLLRFVPISLLAATLAIYFLDIILIVLGFFLYKYNKTYQNWKGQQEKPAKEIAEKS